MESVLENGTVNVDEFVKKHKHYIEMKLLEAEKYDKEHPELYTMAQIKEMLKTKYKI